MSKVLPAMLGCVALLCVGVSELPACGDKFLVGVRGGQYLSYPVVDPTTILVYWPVEPEGDEGDRDKSTLVSSLQQAGHTVEFVEDSESLYREAATRGFEIIMMDVGEARAEQERIEGVAPDATLLPVLNFPTRSEYSAAKKEFGHAVKAPTTLPKLLSKIEKVRPASR